MPASAMKIAEEVASKAPLSVYGCKRMINYARDHCTSDGQDYTSIWNISFLQVEEIQEPIAANADQRPSDFAPLPASRRRT